MGETGPLHGYVLSTASSPSSTFTEYGHYVIDAFGNSNLPTNLTCYPKSTSSYILSVFFSKVCTPGVVLSQGSISFVKVSIVGFGNSPGSNKPNHQPNYLDKRSPAFRKVSPPVPIHSPLTHQRWITRSRDYLPPAIITPCSDHFLPVNSLYGMRLWFWTFMFDDCFWSKDMSRVPINFSRSPSGIEAWLTKLQPIYDNLYNLPRQLILQRERSISRQRFM
jgi:hypothetical protein